MKETEMDAKHNRETFMKRFDVKQSKKSANIEGLLGYQPPVNIPIFLDHCSIFEGNENVNCLTAEIYSADWPSKEDFQKLDEWCRWYGLKYEEVHGIYSWYNADRCRVLRIYKTHI